MQGPPTILICVSRFYFYSLRRDSFKSHNPKSLGNKVNILTQYISQFPP
jgi:hypothetical protein